MTELFKALKIEKNEEHQEINLVEISEDDLMEGNVVVDVDRKSTRLNSSHSQQSRMPSSA